MTAVASTESAGASGLLPRQLRAVPSEPPYDESANATNAHLMAVAGQLPLAFLPDALRPAAPSGHRPVLTLVPSSEQNPADPPPTPGTKSRVDTELHALFGARQTFRRDLPDPRERAAAAVRILMEVLAGDRPARQVAGWVSPSILERLEQHRVTPAHRRARRCYLRSLHVSEPNDAVAEVAAVVSHDGSGSARRRAVAMRLEGREGRWTVTALVVG
jgi:hypothetical protein